MGFSDKYIAKIWKKKKFACTQCLMFSICKGGGGPSLYYRFSCRWY